MTWAGIILALLIGMRWGRRREQQATLAERVAFWRTASAWVKSQEKVMQCPQRALVVVRAELEITSADLGRASGLGQARILEIEAGLGSANRASARRAELAQYLAALAVLLKRPFTTSVKEGLPGAN